MIRNVVIPGRRESGEPGIYRCADAFDKKASVAYALQMPTIKRTDEFSNWLRTEMAKANRSMQPNISTVPR